MTDTIKPKQQASVVRYKAALRKSIRKNAKEPEIDFLNITAMLDLMLSLDYGNDLGKARAKAQFESFTKGR